MTDQPTREEANQSVMYCDWIGNPDGLLIVEAYADGDLLSRAEWEATINREAVMAAFIDAKHRNLTTVRAVHAVLAAIIGGNET